MLKKILVHTRKSFKFIILLSISIFLILGIVYFLYRPTYIVYLNGEKIGYTENKSELQKKINEYIENGDEENQNLAFVQIANMPTYEMCLLKKDVEYNDEEIYLNIINQGVEYYKYYAVLDEGEEKYYVSSYSEAEAVVTSLQEQDSVNKDEITINEKYEFELKELSDTDTVVTALYEEQPEVIAATVTTTTSSYSTVSSSRAVLGIVSLIEPVSGTFTAEFGEYSSVRTYAHTGLDIATTTGTGIKAAASGTVTTSSYSGSYGYLVVINHGNGIETYYAHCSALYVSVGQYVSQGEIIAAVGSTGNSTGPHLHLEVRINGTAYNPRNYVY